MIKFIYFDVGGVVVRDFSGTNKWIELKRNIGVTSKQDKEFNEFFNKHEGEVCLGRDVETLVPLVEEKFGIKFPHDYSLLKDFIDRFEKNESIWSIIKKAKRKYKIGLLTNMYPRMLDLIKQKGLIPNVRWDIKINSSLEGCKKPDEKIYRLAQKRAGAKSREILFVENSKKHIKLAKKLGWQTFLYDSSDMKNASQELGLMLDSQS